MNQLRKCPVCGSVKKSLVKRVDLIYPEDFLLPVQFDVVNCEECGMVYHEVEDGENYARFYSRYTGADKCNYTPSAEYEALIEDTVQFVERYLEVGTDAKILDVGCAYGVLLNTLKQRGYRNLTGMDLDIAAINYLNKNLGIQAVRGSITERQEGFAGKYDLIVLRHIMEHIYNPVDAIENVASWLKPEGRLLIEVPCIPLYYETAPFPGYYIENQHINHFSLHSLDNLMRHYSLVAYECNPNIYPLLRAIYKKDTYDRELVNEKNDKAYVLRMMDEANSKGEQLNRKLAYLKGKKIALWGVGTHVYRMLSHTELKNLNIVHLVDKNPDLQGKRVMGIMIREPEVLNGFDGTIVISGKASREAILADIQKRGFPNEVICLCDEN